jgi:hypothetical protein
MKWMKVGAVVVGGIVVFLILNSVIHLLLGLLGALVFVAIVGGGVYAVAKIVGMQHRHRELGQSPGRRESRPYDAANPRAYDARTTQPWAADEGTTDARTTAPWPAPNTPPGGTPAAHPDVEEDLARLKREMGH